MAAPQALDFYLDELARIRSLPGTKETSFYPAVAGLLNRIGDELRPKVYCLHHPSGGDGIPDFGLFEQASFRRGEAPMWKAGIVPDRGVVEVKGAAHAVTALLASDQVRKKYLPSFGLVLATNLWQFRLLDERATVRESFDLAEDEKSFWLSVNGPRRATLGGRFADFLQRCLLTRVPLARPADVAFFLASYAREALTRLEERATLPALSLLRQGIEKSLGVAFDGKDGEHLFRSTLVQTLFYGLFSAWVVHARSGAGRFDWRAAQWSMTVPVARFLFQQAATPEALQPLQLVPLLDAAAETLNRVDREGFFAAFSDAQAIQYFYEPFLEYFDPVLRRQLGVWYTPSEIVTYMVERVDRVLRTELGRADGLADPDVWILDPCCGTGSYIVEVLRRICRTFEAQGIGDLAGERLKQAALTRVVGFEIMTAPFTIAHWQIGEALRQAGAPLGVGERAAVYLTNALTGWEGGEETGSLQIIFETLAQERAAAITVKQNRPILVVLGNPPYNAFAAVSPESEGGLVEPYKERLQDKWHVRKFNLDDLYIRFYRIAERRIAERTGEGIICFISNYSWLSYSSFVAMRERLLSEFNTIWLDNLNGDSRETGKLTPTGDPDPSVFSTEMNRDGIRVGTCIATMVRHLPQNNSAVYYRTFWGVNKRTDLLESLDAASTAYPYAILHPTPENRFLLRPGGTAASYPSWVSINELSRAADWSGVLEKRRGALMAHDKGELCDRMARYCDPKVTFEELRRTGIGPVLEAARFDAVRARAGLIEAGGLNAGRFAQVMLYPFDERWCFHTNVRPIWNEPRPEVAAQQSAGNLFLVTRTRARKPNEGFPCFVTPLLPGDHLLDPNAHPFPFVLHVAGNESEGLGLGGVVAPNLSKPALRYCAELGLPGSAETSRMVWHHVLAINYSPAWLAENGDGIRQGWPRVPLPDTADLLRASAEIGERVAALLDPHTAVPGVTTGLPRPELATVAVPTTATGAERDWRVTAGWGSRSQRGITMPGRGQTDARAFAEAEEATSVYSALLGSTTRDVWMNGASYWRNVPEEVWNFGIGGYQVLKKWLSYREQSIIERPLSEPEVAHFQATTRRLAALLLLTPELDANYWSCADAHQTWQPRSQL